MIIIAFFLIIHLLVEVNSATLLLYSSIHIPLFYPYSIFYSRIMILFDSFELHIIGQSFDIFATNQLISIVMFDFKLIMIDNYYQHHSS